MDATQMDGEPVETKAKTAITHALGIIRDNPHVAYQCGPGTQTFALLTEAAASLIGRPVREIREHYLPSASTPPAPYADAPNEFVYSNPAFFRKMEEELRANAHKGRWQDWHPDRLACQDEMHHHLRKVGRAMRLCDRERVAESCADLANVAMKTAQEFGGIK